MSSELNFQKGTRKESDEQTNNKFAHALDRLHIIGDQINSIVSSDAEEEIDFVDAENQLQILKSNLVSALNSGLYKTNWEAKNIQIIIKKIDEVMLPVSVWSYYQKKKPSYGPNQMQELFQKVGPIGVMLRAFPNEIK